MPCYLLSPKVTNNIAQGNAASAATLGIYQQRIRSLNGSNRCPNCHRSLFVHFCGAKCFGNRWDEAKNGRNLKYINKLSVPFERGTKWDGTNAECGIPSVEFKEKGVFTGIKGMKG